MNSRNVISVNRREVGVYGVSWDRDHLEENGIIIAEIKNKYAVVSGHQRLLALVKLRNKSKNTIILKQFIKSLK